MKCYICNKEFKSYKGLSSHIRQSHNITSKEYYDRYLKKSDEGFCVECGKSTNFNKLSKGYRKYCSRECSNISSEKAKQISTTLKNNIEHIEKSKKRLIMYNKSKKGRTKSSQIGKITGPANLKKAHAKYDTIKFCPTCGEKTKHIIGVGCGKCWSIAAVIKSKNAIKEKYGVENVFQLQSTKEKIKKISLQKYGCDNPGNSKDARIKAAITRRNCKNDSSWEDYFEKNLLELGINFKTKYNDDSRYPYFCDFYLVDYDIFIEINGYWSHNTHFFDKNNKKDIETLNIWKKKAEQGHKQYKNAIAVWTIKDLEKLKCAKENNINYVVLWEYNDIVQYIEYLKQIIEVSK